MKDLIFMENTIGYDESLIMAELGNSCATSQGSKCKRRYELAKVTSMTSNAPGSVPATWDWEQHGRGSGPSSATRGRPSG